jgi:hypothetical protein
MPIPQNCALTVHDMALPQPLNIGMKTIKIYFSLLAVITFSHVQAQTLFLHTDKETYLPGEILWFKMYALDTASYRPLTHKSVGYVDLLDGKGRSVLQGKIHLGKEHSQGGSLFIPQRLNSGTYTLVGSTLSSQNENRNFQKSVTVLNPFALVDSLPPAREKRLLFFPEGGTWVKDLSTRVAVQTKNENGQGTAAELYWENQKIGQTNARGLGIIKVTPGVFSDLQARFSDGSFLRVNLPEAEASGLVLNAIPAGDTYQVEIKGSTALAHTAVRLQYGKEKSKSLLLNAEAHTSFSIDTHELEEGSSLLTLHGADGKPIAERVLYRMPDSELIIEGKLDKTILKEGESAELFLQGLNLSGWADLSLSVRKVDSLHLESKQNLRTYLYLGQHLQGSIPEEEFYFKNRDERELLLLTRGWRRFKTPSAVQEGRYQLIRIRFTSKTDGKPLNEQVAFLSIPDRSPQLYYAQTDQEGIATFAVRTLYGNKNIAVRLQSGESANMELIRHLPSPANLEFALPYDGKIPSKAYTEQGISVQVENVFSGKQRSTYLPVPASDSISFYGKADARYRLDDYTRFVVMEEVLREYIKEVNVRKNRNEYHLRTLDAARGNFLSEDPLILLDGIPLGSANEIMNYDPLKIQNIEVIAGKYYLGKDTYDGIVSFSTYKGNLDNFQLHPSTTVFAYEGVQLEREFYIPDAKPGTPDQRDVLLWVPKLTLKEKNTHSLKIKSSERTGKYIVDIQGVDSTGKSGYVKLYFEVK